MSYVVQPKGMGDDTFNSCICSGIEKYYEFDAYLQGKERPHYPVPAIPLRTTIQSYGVWIERDNEGLPWTVYQELAPD